MEEILNALQSTNIEINSDTAVEIARMIVVQNYVQMAVFALVLLPLVGAFLLFVIAMYRDL